MPAASDWVTAFLERSVDGFDIDRVHETAPGLDATGILEVLGDPRLGSNVIEAMTELMHPTDSMYYDAIFGAFQGQAAIRNWLVPTMNDVSFIEFVPTAPTEVFGGTGTTSSIDEWQMWAVIGEERMPLPRGVSTRHYRDGWIAWNADVYDTSPMRIPPPDDAGVEAAPLPEPPRTDWTSAPMLAPPRSAALETWLDSAPDARGPLDHADIHTVMTTPELGLDPDVVVPLFHPTDSVLREPGGEYAGAAAISEHLGERRDQRTAMVLEGVGPALFNGDCTAFEWVAHLPRGGSTVEVRGTSVCRYADGHIIAAADYYDSAEVT